MKIRSFLPLAALLAVGLVAGCEQETASTKPMSTNTNNSDLATDPSGKPLRTTTEPTSDVEAPEQAQDGERQMKVDVTREPKEGEEVAVMKTKQGTIVLQFFPEVAPKHVESFKKLAKSGFYDGVQFHRAIPGFMIQGGDPLTKETDPEKRAMIGTGDPGYKVPAEFNEIKHERGILSAARSMDPNSAGSQFFIMVDKAPFLDGQYTVYGKVVSGMDAVDKIVNLETDRSESRGTGGRITEPEAATIESVKIEEWPVK